ncbi:MAG: NUDIX domain-containing protein [Actinomycetes bacterium]
MSLANAARSALADWITADTEQMQLRDEYVQFLDDNDDAMWRACVPGHLTASALVVNAERTHVLLTLHPKFDLWLQLGGHCEPGDTTLREAAEREAREESGIEGLVLSSLPIQLDRHPVGCHGGSWHLDVQFLALAPAGAVEIRSDESLDLAWWPADALPDDTDDAVRRLVALAMTALQ